MTALEDVGKFVAAAVYDPLKWKLLPNTICVTSELGLNIGKLETYMRKAGERKPVRTFLYLSNLK